MEDKVTSHPSFGTIQLNNVSGRHQLFMSSVDHHHFVSLTICEAEHHRNLHYDRVHPGRELIQVLLSPVQLGELLTNMNNGAGTPCTLQRIWEGDQDKMKYKTLPPPPQLTKKATYVEEFKKDVEKISTDLEDALKMAQAMEAKPTVTKGERKAMTDKIEAMMRNIRSNLPFILSSFNENVEKVTGEAKNEVEQYRKDMIERLGMKAFEGQIRSKELDSGDPTTK